MDDDDDDDDDDLGQQRCLCAPKLREEREAPCGAHPHKVFMRAPPRVNPSNLTTNSCDKPGQGETLQAAVEFVRPSGRKEGHGTNLVSSEWLEWNPPGRGVARTGDGR